MTKLSIHIQRPEYPPWLNDYLAVSGAEYIKVIDCGDADPFPGRKTIVRTFLDDGLSNQWVAMGAAGADLWIDKWTPYYLQRPWAHAFEGPNEPPIWDAPVLAGFAAFHQRLIQRMHNLGLKVVVGNINVGWPNYDQVDEIAAGIQGADYFSVHEYAGWDNFTWTGCRYRRTREWILGLGYDCPDILVTECGIDAYDGNTHLGWKEVFANTPDPVAAYIEQLLWYEGELRKDDYVKGAFIFTAMPTPDWYQFDVTEELAMRLALALADLPEPEPPEPIDMARGFMASKYQTTLNWPLIAKDYDYVWLRITGPNTPSGYTHIEVDPWLYEHRAGAQSVNLPCGGFHYLVPDLDYQARIFAEAASSYKWQLPLACDVEAGGLDLARVDRFCSFAVQRLEEYSVVYPNFAIYSNIYLLYKLGLLEYIAAKSYDLWLAEWGVEEPSVSEWDFWQDGGADAPDGEYVSTDYYKGTKEDLYKDYEIEEPEKPEEDGMIKIVDRLGNPVVVDGIEWTWETVCRDFGLSLTQADPPEGATSFELVRLIYDSSAETNWRMYVLDEDGKPLGGVLMFMGIYPDSGQDLDVKLAPRITEDFWGQPEGRPNRALVLSPDALNFTNVDGYIQHSLGSGSNYVAPVDGGGGGGTHWAWRPGDTGDYSFVPAGFGMFRNHEMFWPVFQRTTEGEEPEPPPEDGDLTEVIERLKRIEDKVDKIGVHFT